MVSMNWTRLLALAALAAGGSALGRVYVPDPDFKAPVDVRIVSELSSDWPENLIVPMVLDTHPYVCQLPANVTAPVNTVSNVDIEGAKAYIANYTGCLDYQEGYFAYRVCFNGGIIQFHPELVEGTLRIPNDKNFVYDLGHFDSTGVRYFNLNGPYILKLPYDNGHVCALTGYARTTNVFLRCEDSISVPVIESVDETEICHYEITIAMPDLCGFEGFKHEDNGVYWIECAPDGDFEEAINAIGLEPETVIYQETVTVTVPPAESAESAESVAEQVDVSAEVKSSEPTSVVLEGSDDPIQDPRADQDPLGSSQKNQEPVQEPQEPVHGPQEPPQELQEPPQELHLELHEEL